jgi:hypothetical protein
LNGSLDHERYRAIVVDDQDTRNVVLSLGLMRRFALLSFLPPVLVPGQVPNR